MLLFRTGPKNHKFAFCNIIQKSALSAYSSYTRNNLRNYSTDWRAEQLLVICVAEVVNTSVINMAANISTANSDNKVIHL